MYFIIVTHETYVVPIDTGIYGKCYIFMVYVSGVSFSWLQSYSGREELRHFVVYHPFHDSSLAVQRYG